MLETWSYWISFVSGGSPDSFCHVSRSSHRRRLPDAPLRDFATETGFLLIFLRFNQAFHNQARLPNWSSTLNQPSTLRLVLASWDCSGACPDTAFDLINASHIKHSPKGCMVSGWMEHFLSISLAGWSLRSWPSCVSCSNVLGCIRALLEEVRRTWAKNRG